MERNYVLSVLVNNQSGVLSRISGLFSRRGYNIASLTVGETENPAVSRMTIVINGDTYILDQIKKQLSKLIDVISITELKPAQSIFRELILCKVRANDKNRASIIEITNIFRAKIVDVGADSVITELTGEQSKIQAFLNLMEKYGVLEVARTGVTALPRGFAAGSDEGGN